MKYGQLSADTRIGIAIQNLKAAREQLVKAGARQTLKKLRSTLKSAEGALRNAHARTDRVAMLAERRAQS